MKKYSLLFWIILLSFLEISLEQPLKPIEPSETDFSALAAWKHIEAIASVPHHMGTEANEKVKDYILDEFAKLDIETEVFVGYTERYRTDSYTRLARTENIIARLPGTEGKKAVFLAGHYDSVLKAPGAADDGHAVACMLEVARLMKKEKTKNDIVFLITDGEERGLLGAKTYVENHHLSDIGVFLNYEARGNSGPSISFEWSDGNAGLVKHLKKAGHRPIASSMSYEIYKRLPNDTDFTFFKNKGVPGINHAFIDGFSYYHNPADNPENLNPASVQHTGENMYLMTKHLASVSLEDKRSSNASFFNFLGSLVCYPASWDLFFLLIGILLALLACRVAVKKEGASWLGILGGLGHMAATIVLACALAFLLGKAVLGIYPHYSVFYSGQFYNHYWYFLAALGLALAVSWFMSGLGASQKKDKARKLGFLLILCLLAIGLYLAMPTASYALIFPLMALSLYTWLDSMEIKGFLSSGLGFILIIVPIVLWAPLIQNIFIAFSLKMLVGPAFIAMLFYSAVYCVESELFTRGKTLLIIAIGAFLIGIIGGHLSSAPSPERPLPSSLTCILDNTQDSVYLRSSSDDMVFGSIDWAKTHKKGADAHDPDPSIRLTPSEVRDYVGQSVTRDTAEMNSVLISHEAECYNVLLVVKNTDNLTAVKINDRHVSLPEDASSDFYIEVLGMTRDAFRLGAVKTDDNQATTIQVQSNFLGHPPEIIIDRDDNYSVLGTTRLIEEITF